MKSGTALAWNPELVVKDEKGNTIPAIVEYAKDAYADDAYMVFQNTRTNEATILRLKTARIF